MKRKLGLTNIFSAVCYVDVVAEQMSINVYYCYCY